jgi:hypothetical protein
VRYKVKIKIVLVSIANDNTLINKLLIHELLIGKVMIEKSNDQQATDR